MKLGDAARGNVKRRLRGLPTPPAGIKTPHAGIFDGAVQEGRDLLLKIDLMRSLGDGICAADPFGEGLFLQEQMPVERMPLFICLDDNRTMLQSAVGQKNIVIGAFQIQNL